MKPDRAKALGTYLKARRLELGYSTTKVGEDAEVDQATVVRLEQGAIAAPAPDKLARVAAALGLPAADIFARADYTAPTDLPSFKPYLRAKYRELPAEEVEKIEAYAARLAKRHGVQLDGPAPGEDET